MKLLLCTGDGVGADPLAVGYLWQLERAQENAGVCFLALDALLQKQLAVTLTEVVHAPGPGMVLAAVERKSASVSPQNVKQVLTMSGVMTAHAALHHVNIIPRPVGFNLLVVGMATVVAV